MTRRNRMHTAAARVSTLALLAAALLPAACGGGSEPAAEPAEPPGATTEAPPPATTAEPPAPAAEPPATQAPPPEEPPPAEPEPAPLPGPGLPREIRGYQDWLRLNEDPVPPNPEGDAHLGTKEVFASRQPDRSGGGLVYPDGTIIVKEAVRPDADFIGLVAVMRKEAGADPEHGDWVFVEYTRAGPDARFELQAQDAVCWSCHAGAQETDWVWVHTLGLAP